MTFHMTCTNDPYATRVRHMTQISLHTHAVWSEPYLFDDIFCIVNWLCARAMKTLVRLGLAVPSLSCSRDEDQMKTKTCRFRLPDENSFTVKNVILFRSQ